MALTRLSSSERRAAIISAAIALFSEKGFRGATTRELAAAVGVSEPVLYQHFATKSDLYTAILEEKAVAGECAIPQLFGAEAAAAGDDRGFLTRLAHAIINWHTSDPTYTRLLLFSALENHEFNEIFFERYTKTFFAEVATFFEHRIRAGAFRQMDPTLAAQTFIGMAVHYSLDLTIFKKAKLPMAQDQVVNGFVEIFLEGMKAHAHS